MRFTEIAVFALLGFASHTASTHIPQIGREAAAIQERASNKCKDPPVRKEWRSLKAKEKKAYIDAVLCLQTKPPITSYVDAKNRFDDFHAVHHEQTPSIHWVGHFALWHRFMVAEYERTLREVCKYTGGQPYWDWSLDANPTNHSDTTIFSTAIFSPTIGFGGNGPFVPITDSAQDFFNFTAMGRTGGGCVADGPFTTPAFHVNVNQTTPGACLKRDFTPKVMNWFAEPANVDYVLKQPDYTAFAFALEGVPSFDRPNIHGSGHFGVGGALGTMGNQYNSPGDPLFYLHHGNIDHVLWQWQQRDLKTRLHEVGGPVVPFDYAGPNVTLDFEVDLGEIAGKTSLGELLDTRGGALCYTYEK